MLHKVLYVVAILAALIGFYDTSTRPPGSRGAIEGGILLILSPILGLAGVFFSRLATRACPKCMERIKAKASKCKHCGTEF